MWKKLKEVSTIRGIILLISLFGVNLSPELTEAIISAATALIASIEIFRKERKNG